LRATQAKSEQERRELMELELAGPEANKWTEIQKAAQFLICIGQRGRYMA